MLHFQPAVDLSSGVLLGFEALLRWDHPTRGPITPDVLLPFAEASDRIHEVDAWAVSEACQRAVRWPTDLQVAVNCSLTQLREHRAAEAVTAALESSGLAADRLTIDVTEQAVADEQASSELRTLAGLGIHLAVDDVGTSWSTLENLRRFSIETAKIDRRFIGALEPHEGMHRAIVEAIIHVSHSLGMTTVAEGVETAQQVAILHTFGADAAQGFFFAGPLSAEDTLRLATAEPRALFSLTSRRDDTTTTAVQPPPLTVVDGDGADVPDDGDPPPSARRWHPSVGFPGA